MEEKTVQGTISNNSVYTVGTQKGERMEGKGKEQKYPWSDERAHLYSTIGQVTPSRLNSEFHS